MTSRGSYENLSKINRAISLELCQSPSPVTVYNNIFIRLFDTNLCHVGFGENGSKICDVTLHNS